MSQRQAVFHLVFCPYLPLREPLSFGDWMIGPVSAFEDTWCDLRFRDATALFLSRFSDAFGRPLKNPAILGRSLTIDGTMPSNHEHAALTVALAFAVLESNVRFTQERRYQAWSQTTADNADLLVWPLNVETHFLSITRGSNLLETLEGGWSLNDADLNVRAPLEVHLPTSVNIDSEVLSAAYAIALRAHQGDDVTARRTTLACRWLQKAWRNTPSFDMVDRVVFLKTAFEVLLGTNKNLKAAKRLRAIFERLAPTIEARGWSDDDELLWHPAEQPVFSRTIAEQTTMLTALEDWYMELARARNDILHDGRTETLVYSQPGSTFEGHLFWVGEWVLRTAIKIQFEQLGFAELWRYRPLREIRRALARAARANPEREQP